MKLIFASQNSNKINEIKGKLPQYSIEGLDPVLFPDELSETGNTLDSNALQKARQVYKVTKENCFADDTGLEVEALNGEPGVFSARYAGSHKSSDDNMDLLLRNLQNSNNRKARFRTVIALILDGEVHQFEGVCTGTIITEKRGDMGFGYDPIFIPDGFDKTFAEMSMSEKSAISHRGKAVDQLVAFLRR
jgi:XTP/dITP diphosphohydrolase